MQNLHYHNNSKKHRHQMEQVRPVRGRSLNIIISIGTEN